VGKIKGDFGGVSYTQGDFHTKGMSGMQNMTGDFVTNGTSGLGTMGFSLNDVFSSVFGEGAEAVKSTLQSGAANVATNVVGSKLASDAAAKQGIVDTAKTAISQIYTEYKMPILIVGGGVALLAGLGLYNTFKKRK